MGSPSSQIESLFAPPPPGRNQRTSGDAGRPAPLFPPAESRRPAVRESSAYGAPLSVGKQLLHARLAHGWTIEDVAFQTHIPHTLLREMENDDLSNFANLTYAKGFLKLYSRHIGLDLSDYLDQFDTSVISAVTGHEYIQTARLVRSLSAPAIAPDVEGNPRARLLLTAIVTALVIIVAFVFMKFSHSSPSADHPPVGRSNGGEAARPGPLTASAGSGDKAPSRPVPRAEIVQE